MEKLPEFESDDEMAEWFDTHDTAPYLDSMEEVKEKIQIIRSRFRTKPVNVQVRADYLEAIETLAARRGVSHQMLIQRWLKEKLQQEAPDLTPK